MIGGPGTGDIKVEVKNELDDGVPPGDVTLTQTQSIGRKMGNNCYLLVLNDH